MYNLLIIRIQCHIHYTRWYLHVKFILFDFLNWIKDLLNVKRSPTNAEPNKESFKY